MPPKLTHNALQAAVVQHYAKFDSFVALSELRESTGYGAEREADVVAFGVWPSRGMDIIGHEVKVNRSDWLHELKDGSKAEAVAQYCHIWILVTLEGVAKLEEIPSSWGWWVYDGKRMKVMKEAGRLEPKEVDRRFVASIMRNIKKNYMPTSVMNQAIDDMNQNVAQQVTDKYGKQLEEITTKMNRAEEERDNIRDLLKRFEDSAGFYLSRFNGTGIPAETAGKCLRMVRNKGVLDRFIQLLDEKHSLERRLRELKEFTDLLENSSELASLQMEEKK